MGDLGRNKYRFILIITVMIVTLLAACQPAGQQSPDLGQSVQQDDQLEQHPNEIDDHDEQTPAPYETTARLIAVGDIMMHAPQTKSGYDATTKTYQFDSFFSEVTDILSEGDWVIGNLETPLSGNDPRGYTGFPEFNAPPELADAIKNAGFNILTTANNHALDRRERGVLATLDNIRSRDMLAIGTASSQEEADEIHVVTHHEISMAILSYTYGTNGIPVPAGKPYLVSLIDEQKMIEDIHKARELGVDLVTLVVHWGNEYQLAPTKEQQLLADSLLRAGADLILGSHPHVLQPYEVKEITRDDGTTAQGIIIYSMGNFISNQDRIRNNKKPTDVGVIFEIDIHKSHPNGKIEFTAVEARPTYVHKWVAGGKQQYRVLPLGNVLDRREDSLLKQSDYTRLDGYYKEAVSILARMTEPAKVAVP